MTGRKINFVLIIVLILIKIMLQYILIVDNLVQSNHFHFIYTIFLNHYS